MHIPEDILSTLTEEQKKRVEAAKSADELLAIMDEVLEYGYHVEKFEDSGFWGENTYMICYW